MNEFHNNYSEIEAQLCFFQQLWKKAKYFIYYDSIHIKFQKSQTSL